MTLTRCIAFCSALFVQTSASYSVCFNRFELFGEAKLRCACLSNLHIFMWISNCSLLYHQLSPTVFWYVCNSELISLLVLYLGDEFDMNYREKCRAGNWDWWCWLLYFFFQLIVGCCFIGSQTRRWNFCKLSEVVGSYTQKHCIRLLDSIVE